MQSGIIFPVLRLCLGTQLTRERTRAGALSAGEVVWFEIVFFEIKIQIIAAQAIKEQMTGQQLSARSRSAILHVVMNHNNTF